MTSSGLKGLRPLACAANDIEEPEYAVPVLAKVEGKAICLKVSEPQSGTTAAFRRGDFQVMSSKAKVAEAA